MGHTPNEEIIPHHYAPPPNFTVFLTHWGDKRSSFFVLPSDPNKLNLDSSLKGTIFHCSSLLTIYALRRSQDEPFDFSLKSIVCNMESEPLIFPYLNYEKPFFWWLAFLFAHKNAREIDFAVLKRSFKDVLTIIRYSRLVLIESLPVLGFGLSILLAINLLIKR